jgi:hypothetical protein
LLAIAALGLSKLVIIGPSAGSDMGEAMAALARFAGEVMPALRS